MFRKMMYLVSLIIVLGLVSGVKGDVIDSFESGPGAWEIMNPPETLAQGTEGVTDGASSLERNFTAGFNFIDLSVGSFVDALNANETLEVDVTTSLTTEQVGTYLQTRIILQGGGETDNYYIEGPLISVASPDGTPTTTTVTFDYKAELVNGPLMNWAKIRLVNNSDGEGVVYYDNLRVVSAAPAPAATVIGDFEDSSMDNWVAAWDDDPILENSTTGVTSGSGSLSVTTTGGYYCLQWDAPTIPESLADQSLQFDLTMIASEWPVGQWTKVADKVAVNSDGASGWVEYTSATAIDKISGDATSADWGRWSDTDPDAIKTYTVDISDYDLTGATWFQIVISIQGGDGLAHFYFDNMKLVGPAADTDTGKSTDFIIGNFEQDLDRWVVGGGADVRYSDTNGVTLDNYSIDIFTPTGAWAEVLTMDLLEPNNVDILAAFRANTKVTADITHLVVDWPVDNIPPWNGTHFVINVNGDALNTTESEGFMDLGYQAGWTQDSGDRTDSVTWDYSKQLSWIDFDKVTYLQFFVIANANSEDYTGWIWFYIDNMKLLGGGIPLSPQPADAATETPIELTLIWTAGTSAASHHLYFGTDWAKVNDADMDSDPEVMFVELDEASFDPNELEFNTRYYWRIDEVNEANPDSPWKGPAWSFTTGDFIVVEDFEDYNAAENRIWYSWHDGLGYGTPDTLPYYAGNGTGSSVGDDTTPSFCEETIVHTGGQSMPIYFNNTGAALISEVEHVWDEPQVWSETAFGSNTLKLYVQGFPLNKAGELYLILEDSAGVSARVTNADSAIFTAEEWTEWEISLNDLASEGVNLTAVKKLVIGIANIAGQPAANGKLYIDDIRRHPPVAITIDPDIVLVPKTAVAPIIDGVWDAVWDDVNVTECLITDIVNTDNATPEDSNDLSASFKAFYDDTNFYIFLEIKDSLIDYEFSDWQGDGVEIYFDGDNSNGTSYDGINDNQIRITVDDVAIADIDSSLPIDGTVFKVLLTDSGYNIEASFPLEALQIYPSEDPEPLVDADGVEIPNSGIAPNNIIGFEIQINDNDATGSRETMMRWHSDDNNSWQDPSLFGQARLVSDTVGN